MSLRLRARDAAFWTILAYGIETTIRLASTLIMTRLLFPEAFAQVTLATSLMIGITMLSDVGLRTVIVRSPHGEAESFLQTAWTFQVCRGVLLWIVFLALSYGLSLPAIRSLFRPDNALNAEGFPLVVAAISFSLLLSGLESTAVHLNARRINFRQIGLIDSISRLCSFPPMIVWAWLAPSVWPLVGGTLITTFVRLVLTFTYVPGPKMAFRWDRAHVSEIVLFGRWIGLSSAATFLYSQGDRVLTGLLFSSEQAGFYSIAKLMIETASSVFVRLNAALATPLFGEILREREQTIRAKYYQFRLPFELSVPLLGGVLFSVGALAVHILFDSRYAGVGPMLQILSASLIFFPALLVSSIFGPNGEPHLTALVSAVQAMALFVCLLGGWLIAGETGLIWGAAIHPVAPAFLVIALGVRRAWIWMWREAVAPLLFVLGALAGQLFLILFV